jgi:hypothetical protein
MTQPTPGAPTTEPVQPATPALTDDHAQALLADAVATANAANAATPAADDDPASKIARLEADLRSARAEAGKSRVNAKQAAADEARAELAQQIGKALGLVQNDEPADPAKLTEQLTAAGAEARQAKVALAVYQTAEAANADPAALLDSRTFLEKVATLDPNDTTAIGAAITEAVTANPRLGRAQAAPTVGMRPNPAQGASASPPLGIGEQIAAATAAGNTKLAIRLKAAQALNPS